MQPIKIKAPFATAYDTAKVLGVPERRVNQLIGVVKDVSVDDVAHGGARKYRARDGSRPRRARRQRSNGSVSRKRNAGANSKKQR